MRMKRVRLNVSFLVPTDTKARDCRDYVLDAVASWRGQLRSPFDLESEPDDIGDPMWYLDPDSVRVAVQLRKKP